MTRRSLIQRSAVLLGLVLLSCYLFYTGKGHILYLDTNAVTIDGKEYKAPETLEVSVDGRQPESMGRAERAMVPVGGPRHTLSIEVVSGGDQKLVQRITLPTFVHELQVSIPAILGGAPASAWVTRFQAAAAADAPAEKMQSSEDPADAAKPATPADPAKPAVPAAP